MKCAYCEEDFKKGSQNNVLIMENGDIVHDDCFDNYALEHVDIVEDINEVLRNEETCYLCGNMFNTDSKVYVASDGVYLHENCVAEYWNLAERDGTAAEESFADEIDDEYVEDDKTSFQYDDAKSSAGLVKVEKDEKGCCVEKTDGSAFVKPLNVVITGKLSGTRAGIISKWEKHGVIIQDSVTTKTDYLVTNEKPCTSSKGKTAEKLGIPILSEEEFERILAERNQSQNQILKEQEVGQKKQNETAIQTMTAVEAAESKTNLGEQTDTLEQVKDKDENKPTTVVITGALSDTRANIISRWSQYGVVVKDSVSAQTDYLVTNEKPCTSSKSKAAEKYGAPIVSEDEFERILMEGSLSKDLKGTQKCDENNGYIKELTAETKMDESNFIDSTSQTVETQKYEKRYGFNEGLAPVKRNGKWGYIDVTEREVVQPQYDDAKSLNEGLAPIKRNGQWGYIDVKGREVVQPQYDDAKNLNKGMARVQKLKKWGFVNQKGLEIVSPQYEDEGLFSEGLAKVKKNGKWGYIDTTGREIVQPQYDEIEDFYKSQARVCVQGNWDFIDKKGMNMLIPIKKKGKYAYFDAMGREVVPPMYDSAEEFSEGLAVVKVLQKDWKYGFIDVMGREVVPPVYDYARTFSEGISIVEKNKKWGFIDMTGREVVSPQYESLGNFSEGLADVEKDGEWGFIDMTGREVVPPQYRQALRYRKGLGQVLIRGKWKYIDKTGTIVSPKNIAVEDKDPLEIDVENNLSKLERIKRYIKIIQTRDRSELKAMEDQLLVISDVAGKVKMDEVLRDISSDFIEMFEMLEFTDEDIHKFFPMVQFLCNSSMNAIKKLGELNVTGEFKIFDLNDKSIPMEVIRIRDRSVNAVQKMVKELSIKKPSERGAIVAVLSNNCETITSLMIDMGFTDKDTQIFIDMARFLCLNLKKEGVVFSW